MPKLFSDRSLPARCPFCRRGILPPREINRGQWYDFPGGYCACGAVFAHDPTARNGGAVLLQAMLMACGGDMERALSLSLETDYDEAIIRRYNGATHRVEPQAFGTLYFIRLREGADSGEADH